MPRILPPLNALRAFEVAGRLGSFSKAAAELNVTHSAISRHVRGLEKRLNVHLFRTENSGVALTEHLTSAPNVASVRTSLVIRCAKDEPGVPFDVLEARAEADD